MIKPIVSVIIPMFNSRETIGRTLESAVNQSYKEIEIIIVDDGSTDDSLTLVNEFILQNSNNNIKIISQKNSGVSAARNTGISNANGNYISFLDSDDWWKKNKIEKQVEIMEGNPSIYLLGTKTISNNYSEKKCSVNYISFKKLLKKNYIVTSSAILRRKTFDNGYFFDTTKKHSEDYELWLRIAYFYKVAVLNQPLVYYNVEVSGLSSQLVKMEKEELLNYKKLLKNKQINVFTYNFIKIYSVLKFFRRVTLKYIREIRN